VGYLYSLSLTWRPFYDAQNTMLKEAGYRYETNVDSSLYLRGFVKIDNF